MIKRSRGKGGGGDQTGKLMKFLFKSVLHAVFSMEFLREILILGVLTDFMLVLVS